MRVTVKKWGNSASVRIPAAIMDAANLKLDAVVDITEENGRVIIEPVHGDVVALEQLLAAITADNLHDAADFGTPVGKEAL
jgi:antitoxin MazE